MLLVWTVLAALGLAFLWRIFCGDNQGKAHPARRQTKTGENDDMTSKLVKEIENRSAAESKLREVKGTNPSDIGSVVKHWIEEGNK